MSAEQLAFPLPVAGLAPVSLAWANTLLTRWGHYLGPVERPFGSQAWVLDVLGEPVSVAVSCSTVSEHVNAGEGTLARGEPLWLWMYQAGGSG